MGHATAAFARSQASRAKLWARLARLIFAVARTLPTVRMTRARRHFCAAKTCSTRERTLARVALPRAMCVGIGLPLGLAAEILGPGRAARARRGSWPSDRRCGRAELATLASEEMVEI